MNHDNHILFSIHSGNYKFSGYDPKSFIQKYFIEALANRSQHSTETFIMGAKESKVEEHKTVDATGTVNNNVVLQPGTVDVYSQELVILGSIICLIKLIEVVSFLYYKHKKSIKRQYLSSRNIGPNNGA